jgi:hypothetical protein
MDSTPYKPLFLLRKLPENEVPALPLRLNIVQFKCMRKRQAGYFLSSSGALAKFPA